jgi:serine/threonine protein kinase
VKTIRLTSAVSTGLDPVFATAGTIDIEDVPFGQGGFGVAYRALRFDGRSTPPQVVKLLVAGGGAARQGFDTTRALQQRLRDENLKLGGTLLRQFPALQAVPQLSFEGQLDGRPVLGYTANDLTHAGFEELGGILNNPVRARHFRDIAVPAKMRIAAEIVSAFEFLNSVVRFMHADIKAEALFLDLRGFHAAIIDFDSGAVAQNAGDKPTTYGTKQDWLAPEIAREIDAPGNARRIVHVDMLSDVWSVNIAIHYLLTGLHPLFFLSEISKRSMDAYVQRFKWPDVDPGFKFFEKGLAKTYQRYMAFVRASVPRTIIERLSFTITNGFSDPTRRTLYGQWKSELNILNQPGIRRFAADRLIVEDGTPVHLTWDVTGASRLELSHVGDVTGRTSADVSVIQDTVFDLVLTPAAGSPVRKSLTVQIDRRPPAINAFQTSEKILTMAKPARLTWNVARAARVQIDHGVGDVTLQTAAEVLPRQGTTYTLTATSFFGVTATATVRIDVSDAPPAIAYFRADSAVLQDGRPATLSWQVSADAHQVEISGIGPVDRSGSRTVEQRRPQTYVLTAVSYFGKHAEQQVQVDVSRTPPVIDDFSAAPLVLPQAAEALLRWSARNAETVSLEPDGTEVPPSGELRRRAEVSTKFTLRARSWYGEVAERSVNITVIRKAVIDRSRFATLDRTKVARLNRSGTKLPSR